MEMDKYEQEAHDLEISQEARYRRANQKSGGNAEAFWADRKESAIFDTIKSLRRLSNTYHPDNLR